jgi:tetratricopeptide (TPR) repeat protein
MCRHEALLALLSVAITSAAYVDASLTHLGRASQLLDQERFEEAAAEYQSALDNNSESLNARRGLAICRFELRQYETAEKLLSELLTHTSTAAMAHYYLGRLDLTKQEFNAAITHFLSIPRAHPFRDERYFLAMAYFKSAAWERCEETVREWIQENPRDFRSHQLLARALHKLGRESPAEAEFSETRKLLAYYTEGSQALKRCGQTLSGKNTDEIARICGPLLETDDVDKLAALGTLLGKAGFYVQAEAAWKRAALLDPESPEIRYDLAITCFHLEDRGCARDNAKAALQTRADFPEANILYGSVLYTMGADTEALPALRKAHALSPRDNLVRELLSNEIVLWAEQYVQTGKTSNARLLLSELNSLQPLPPAQQQRLVKLQRLLDDVK